MAYKNKKDQAKAAHRYYLKNKKVMNQRAMAFTALAKKRNAEYVYKHLLSHPCVDCGESDPLYLDPDHVRGKKRGNISDLARSGLSLKTLQEEIDKCEIRCVRCHRRKTAEQQNWWILRRMKEDCVAGG